MTSFSSAVPADSAFSSDAVCAAVVAGFETMRAAEPDDFEPRLGATEVAAGRASSSKIAGFAIAADEVFF